MVPATTNPRLRKTGKQKGLELRLTQTRLEHDSNKGDTACSYHMEITYDSIDISDESTSCSLELLVV